MAPAPVDENGMTPEERDEYECEYNAYLDSIGTSFAEVQEKSVSSLMTLERLQVRRRRRLSQATPVPTWAIE